MNIMMGIVREDTLTTLFESTWSRVTNRIAYTSTERACNQNSDINEGKRRGNFLIIFNTPVLPVDRTRSKKIINDKQKTKHQVGPKLMLFVPK